MDNNYKSYCEECGLDVRDMAIGDVNNWHTYDDMLKFSNCWNVNVNNCVVVGGKEDCVDMCRGGGYVVQNSEMLIMGKNGITAKCGIDGLRIEGITFNGKGHYSEIEIGMFSKYDKWPFKNAVENIVISDVKRSDGKRVRIWLWNSDKPIIRPNSKVWLIRVPKLIWMAYFLFRQIVVRFYG